MALTWTLHPSCELRDVVLVDDDADAFGRVRPEGVELLGYASDRGGRDGVGLRDRNRGHESAKACVESWNGKDRRTMVDEVGVWVHKTGEEGESGELIFGAKSGHRRGHSTFHSPHQSPTASSHLSRRDFIFRP